MEREYFLINLVWEWDMDFVEWINKFLRLLLYIYLELKWCFGFSS